jgi:deoxyribose-phosphate aldolase
MRLADFIDHTILKQTTTRAEVDQLCSEAKDYGFKAVCIPPTYVSQAASLVKGSPVRVATVIGFPFGYHSIESKTAEAATAISEGAHELDMVINLTKLRNGDEDHLKREVASLLENTRQKDVLVKLIIESGILTEKEIIQCCLLYREFEVAFLKTSTGYAENGASVQAVQLMRANLPDSIQIKASGGIRDYSFARQLIDAGATRLGCSASISIIKGETGSGAY